MTVSPAPAAPATTRWAHVFLIVLVGALAACQIGKVAPSLPLIRGDLDITMVDAGWIASVYTGTAVLLGLIGGALADRFGHRNGLVAGLLLVALGSAAGSVMDTLGPLIATRIVEGMGFILIVVSAPALIFAATAPRHRGLAVGVWGLFMPIGLTAMLLLSPLILAAWDWRALWRVNTALALLAALLVLWRLADRRASVDPTRLWRDLAVTVRLPAPWILSIAFGLFSAPYSAMMAWLPTLLIETQARSPALAAAMTAVVAVLHAPGALLGGWLVGRGVARWRVIGGACGVMGVTAVAALGLGLGPIAAYAAILLFSFAGGMVPTAILAAAPAMAPSLAQVGAFNGILIHGANVGTLIGPPALAGVVSAFGGWDAGGLYLGLVGGSGVLIALVIRRLEQRLPRKGDAAA